jgi:hypothetical protein
MNDWNYHKKYKHNYMKYTTPFFINFYKGKGKRKLTEEQLKEKALIRYAIIYKENRENILKKNRIYYEENRVRLLKEKVEKYHKNKD